MILNELKIQSDPCIIPSVSNGSVDERKPIGFKPIDLDGGYGRCVVLVSILIIAFADGFVYSFKDIMQPFISEFVEIDNKVSLIQSLLTSLMLATGPLSSAMCNRFGCRITTIIGAFVASTGCAISYKANSMEFLMFSVGIVMGTGFGLMYCPAIVMVTMYFKRIRSFAIVIYDEEEEEMKKITNNDKETRNQKEWQDHHVSIDLQLNERPEPIAEEDEDKASLHITDDKKENRMVMKMMDLSLFADPVFLLFVNSNFLTTIIFISLPTFMRNALRDHNLISQSEVYSENYYRISESEVYRLAGFFGLIVISLVGDSALPFKYGKDCARNRLWIYSWFLMISGVASAFAFLMVGLWVLISYCIIFGSFMISYRFTPVILLDLIGIERFTNAFGLLLLVQGIATFIGLHFGVMDIQWRYDWIIVFCGICLFLSGIMLFNIPFMTKHQNEVGFKNSAEKHGERPLLH
uniref:Uncharacterized protein n=1 Tax=Acrobeloides nanus TaxID=290746 RepID=A0A914DS38_9BILA